MKPQVSQHFIFAQSEPRLFLSLCNQAGRFGPQAQNQTCAARRFFFFPRPSGETEPGLRGHLAHPGQHIRSRGLAEPSRPLSQLGQRGALSHPLLFCLGGFPTKLDHQEKVGTNSYSILSNLEDLGKIEVRRGSAVQVTLRVPERPLNQAQINQGWSLVGGSVPNEPF